MSVVTKLVLFCHADEGRNLNTIQSYLLDRGQGGLLRLNDAFGGVKRPEINAYGAAYNMFDVDSFIKLFMNLSWQTEEEVLLVVRAQDAAILTYKPSFTSTKSA